MTSAADVELFVAAVAPPPHLLLLGGGPDARPVATLAAFLGWRITVVDHRAAYLVPERFPPATRLVEARAADVAAAVQLADFSAAIVMSHHLESDLHYLRALAASPVPYVGLLGPAARREKLLQRSRRRCAGCAPGCARPWGSTSAGARPNPSRCPSSAKCMPRSPVAPAGRSARRSKSSPRRR